MAIKSDISHNNFKSNLTELSVSLAYTAMTLPFVVTGVGQISLLVGVVSCVAFNALLREMTSDAPYEPETKLLRYLRALTFSRVDSATRDVLTHEMGHDIAAKTLFRHANPSITVFPFEGGVTHWSPGRGLTELGAYFGKKNSRLIVAGAGAGAALLFSMGHMIAAHKVSETNPEASAYLLVSALMSIANHVIYALTALVDIGPSGHDFIQLAQGGIHPLAAAGFLIAVPLLLQMSLYLFVSPNKKH